MLPVVFRADWPVLLAGRGPALAKRLGVLEGAALGDLTVFTDAPEAALAARAGDRLRPGLPGPADIEAARLVFGAGLTPAESEALAAAARARRIPVNIEDVPPLCDFHVPAMVRRGDLTLTVSTAGQAPALAAALRAWLEGEFGPDWEAHMREVAALRASLRAQGASPGEVIRGVARHLEGAGWAPLGRRAA
jgi:precorrin-2 dehydrogenase/sirohydrochlorin ferrochelatase